MGRSVLAVVPARGGSKGVALKNIRPLCGRPLLLHTADVIREAGFFDRAIVSTDHQDIAQVAADGGLDVPFLRPASISGDQIGDCDVLVHALETVERDAPLRFDVVVMLQPTSPLRTPRDVRLTVTHLIEGDWDAVWTVSPTPIAYHPLKQLDVSDSGALSLFDERGRDIVARQQLRQVYHRNGVAYAFSRRCLLDWRTILPQRTRGLVIQGRHVSIDTVGDFATVEQLMAERRDTRRTEP